MGEQQGDIRGARKRRLTGQRLEEQAAERIDVGSAVDLAAADLLGSDVVERAEQLSIGGSAIGHALRETEVREVAVLPAILPVDQHVRRLDVAMDEPAPVRRVERVGDLPAERDDPRRLEHPLRPQERPEVRPVDVAHRDEQAAVDLTGLVDRDHVRMVERRREPRLAKQPLAEALVVGELGGEELERDRPVEAGVAGAVDLAHPTPAGQFLDEVPGEPFPAGQSLVHRGVRGVPIMRNLSRSPAGWQRATGSGCPRHTGPRRRRCAGT